MDSTAQISLALAFAVGVVSLISLSVLALVPVHVAFLGEAAAIVGVAPVYAGPAVKLVPRRVFGQALLFTASFDATLTPLGVSVGLLGATL
jgi:cytochrome c biogenesis protein CcdA